MQSFKNSGIKYVSTRKNILSLNKFINCHRGSDALTSLERLNLTYKIVNEARTMWIDANANSFLQEIEHIDAHDPSDFWVTWTETDNTEKMQPIVYRIAPKNKLIAGSDAYATWIRSIGFLILKLWSTDDLPIAELIKQGGDLSANMNQAILFETFLNNIDDMETPLAMELKTLILEMLMQKERQIYAWETTLQNIQSLVYNTILAEVSDEQQPFLRSLNACITELNSYVNYPFHHLGEDISSLEHLAKGITALGQFSNFIRANYKNVSLPWLPCYLSTKLSLKFRYKDLLGVCDDIDLYIQHFEACSSMIRSVLMVMQQLEDIDDLSYNLIADLGRGAVNIIKQYYQSGIALFTHELGRISLNYDMELLKSMSEDVFKLPVFKI